MDRILALSIIFSLILPNPAWALRPSIEGEAKAGLEESLRTAGRTPIDLKRKQRAHIRYNPGEAAGRLLEALAEDKNGAGAGLEENPVAAALRRLDLSQTEFGKALSRLGYNSRKAVSQGTISLWKLNQRPIPQEVLNRLPRIYKTYAPRRISQILKKFGLKEPELVRLLISLGYRTPLSPETVSGWRKGDVAVPSEVLDLSPQFRQAAVRLRLGKSRNPKSYDPMDVAQRLTGALLRRDASEFKRHLDPATGVLTLNPVQASKLLDGGPTSPALRRGLGDQVNQYLPSASQERSKGFASWLPGLREIRITVSRIVDTRPWNERRLSRIVHRAREKKLSFRPAWIQKGSQSESPLGRELKSAYGQIVRTNNFPSYGRNWFYFLKAHGVSATRVYGKAGRHARDEFSVFVDLKRDERGLPIPARNKFVANLKLNRLDSILQNRRVRSAKTIFLLGVNTWLMREGAGVCFSHNGESHLTNIPAGTFQPAQPLKLALEIAVADPQHAVQAARRMDTGEVVYPYKGQVQIFLDPPFKDGQVQEGAFLFRAVTNISDKLWKEIARLAPKSVYLTHLQGRAKRDSKRGPRTRVYFTVAEKLYTTSLSFHEDSSSELTVQVDSVTRTPLQAWDMGTFHLVFPANQVPSQGPFDVFVDPERDNNGLVKAGSSPSEITVTNPVWARVWSKLQLAGAKTIVIQNVSSFRSATSQWRSFTFENENYSTSIPAGSDDVPVQIEFSAADPDRRPQVARRMDTGEIVYPASGQKRILLDPHLVEGRAVSGGRLYKAAHFFRRRTMKGALKSAKQAIAFKNLPIFESHGGFFFRDPINRCPCRTSLNSGSSAAVTAIAYPKNGNGWAVAEAYIPSGPEVFPIRIREKTIENNKKLLRRTNAPAADRARAAQQLYRLGALDVPSDVTVQSLSELLFDYHTEFFGKVGVGPFVDLVAAASDRYRREPGLFWNAVFVPLQEAERLPPLQATRRLQAAFQSLVSPAGLEEPRTMDLPDFERPWEAKRDGARLEQIESAKRKGGTAAVDVKIPHRFPVYVQGETLWDAVIRELRRPSGADLDIIPISEGMNWQDIGIILENALMDKPADNPKNLPVRRIVPADVAALDPVALMAQILRQRLGIPAETHVGQMLYTDEAGQAHLVLFTKA